MNILMAGVEALMLQNSPRDSCLDRLEILIIRIRVELRALVLQGEANL